MTISQRLFTLMSERGISKAQLVKGTGIKSNTISDWQTKGTNPPADKIACICEYLGVSAYWLLTGKEETAANSAVGCGAGDMSNSASVNLLECSQNVAELARVASGLGTKSQIKLVTLAYSLEEEQQAGNEIR